MKPSCTSSIPDTFERIVSQDQKRDIAKRLSYLTDEEPRT